MTDIQINRSAQKNQLLWRCRLGTRELELLLYRYIEKHYAALTVEQIETFEEFIGLSHEQLNSWLLLGEPVNGNNKYAGIIKAIRENN